MKEAIKFALIQLHGVGQGGSNWYFLTNPPGMAVHVQKPLTDGEKLMLPRGWLSIPAVDELGPVSVISHERGKHAVEDKQDNS